jgi:putative transposase
MPEILRAIFLALICCVRSRRDLVLENLALQQQLAALSARQLRPRLAAHDRLFWIILRRFWSDWRSVLVIVHPETVVRWHRSGFKMYWKWISRRPMRSGRKPTPKALRELIFRMVVENSAWGAPRIHGELKMLGYKISEERSSAGCERRPGMPSRGDVGRHS